MDEKLREIYFIQPLQEEALTFRNDTRLLRKILKQTCIAEVKKMEGVQIVIAEKELKLIKPEEWPKFKKIETPQIDVKEMLEDCKRTSQALDLFK